MKKAIALTLTLAMAVTMAGCGNNQKGTVTSASGKKISTDLIKGSIKLADYKGLEVYEDEIKVEDTEVQSQIDNLLKEKQEEMRISGTADGEQILQMEEELAAMRQQQRELQEAVTAGNTALFTAGRILDSLSRAGYAWRRNADNLG